MISRILYRLILFFSDTPKSLLIALLLFIIIAPFAGIFIALLYEEWDKDPDRGAIALEKGTFNESYALPEYLNQGWENHDSLWFYNTTQGSALLPYDFLLALEQPQSNSNMECHKRNRSGAWFICDSNVDRFRYLPQKATAFNPDGLPVGFVKERYQGKDYVGYTCAACHTGQVNYRGRALRIDGGPAMADMVGFLAELTQAMVQTQRQADQENPRLKRFIDRVLELDNDYVSPEEVEADLVKWSNTRQLYNIVNHSDFNCSNSHNEEDNAFCSDKASAASASVPVKYGYARLDAFGRIYNRVLQHAINPQQLSTALRSVTRTLDGVPQRLLSDAQVHRVLEGVVQPGGIILRDHEMWQIIDNLQSTQPGYPALSRSDMLRVRNSIFNAPNAPVSYPFLWDITHSDYVQWNAIASNAALGPLGRNAGEVTGVFAILDWRRQTGLGAWFEKFSLPALISGQGTKREVVNFKSSINLFNLQRLEYKLSSLVSPRWPFCKNASSGDYYLPDGRQDQPVDERACRKGDSKLDSDRVARGQLSYAEKCQGCHQLINRTAADRLMVGTLVGIDHKQSTDKAMASNSVFYQGKSGNFSDTYQQSPAGTLVMAENAPVAMILTATTAGSVATADADKWWPRRIAEWLYTIVLALIDNPIKESVKAGIYKADTTAQPFNSLLSYRARSLNGIWATAPYLHNGSVPTLYDLLLPAKAQSDCTQTRPERFRVGAREFDPSKVGFKSAGYEGFIFDTRIRGNHNSGHEYGACGMSDQERWDLVEFLKSL